MVDGIGTSCTFDYLATSGSGRTFVILLFIGGFVAPFLVIIASYIAIFYTLHKHRQYVRREMGGSQDLAACILAKPYELRLVLMSIAVISLFCAAWLPYSTVALLGLTGRGALLAPLTSTIPAIFAKASCTINPILYCLSYKRFRKRMLLKLCASCAQQNSHVPQHFEMNTLFMKTVRQTSNTYYRNSNHT